MNQQNFPTRNRPVLQVVTGAVVVMLYFAVVVYAQKADEQAGAAPNAPVLPIEEVSENQNTSPYKNGTYTATGTYSSPGGREQVIVNITLENGVVTASTVTPIPASPTSEEFQKQFASGYKQFVIGKAIDTLSVDTVAGSSLTGIGFNTALDQIRTQAES